MTSELGREAQGAADGAAPTTDQLEWHLFDDVDRLAFVQSLDEGELLSSTSLQRVTRVAAIASSSPFAQVSLIGESQFVPAAHGLAYDPDSQHTPIRDSLCSVTMASGGTLRVDDTRRHEWTSGLPPVVSGGVAAYLGVALRDPDGRPVGALCVFDENPRQWLDDDEALLTDLAELVTRELHLLAALENSASSELRMRQVIVELVNRPRLGTTTSLSARAHYAFPANAPAGGDWIDWVELPDRVAFSIGDVAGHGLASIAVMEELRHSLRAYAIESVEPGDAIVKTSEFLRTLRKGNIATAIKADFDPVTGRTRFAVAGHPPPIHLRDGHARLVPVQPGPPLGVLTVRPATTELILEPGDRLILCTDGVFERRDEPLDVGLQRLARLAELHAGNPDLDDTARALVEECIGELRDDACLLLVERPKRIDPV